jgi:carboxyl-terminal processing protease
MIRRALAPVLLCLLLLAVGILLGGHPGALPGFVRDPLVGDQSTRRLDDVLDLVHSQYYVKYSRKDLADRAAHGLVSSLEDPYSRYLNGREYTVFQHQSTQQFSGVGIAVAPAPQGLKIVEVYDGSPAQAAGVRSGDLIVAAAGKPLKGLAQSAAVKLIKGPDGSTVRLGLLRGAAKRSVTLKRQQINVPPVDSVIKKAGGKKVAVIAISAFTDPDTAPDLRNALRKVAHAGARGLVLDLRDNPGGLVTQAQQVASEFIVKGRIVTTKGRAVRTQTLDAIGDPSAPKLPLVVLVNENSASAAEIVAGALQDDRRAKLVGTRTYGKGVFQQLIPLKGGGALDITAGQYFTPKGHNLGGRGTKRGAGLTPDVKVRDDPKTPHRDEQLDAALKTLAAQLR